MQNFNQPLFDDLPSFEPDWVQDEQFPLFQSHSSDQDYNDNFLESEYISNYGKALTTHETKCPTFPDESKTGTSFGSFFHQEQISDDIEENPSKWTPLDFEPKKGKTLAKRPKLEKLPYNYINRVFEGILKKDVLTGRYHGILKEYFAEPKEFCEWLKGVKYNNVRVCKEVWRHKIWNKDDQENNFKLILTLITQRFLEKGGAAQWIQNSVRQPAYREKYRSFERLILKAMIGKYPEFISFKVDFDD